MCTLEFLCAFTGKHGHRYIILREIGGMASMFIWMAIVNQVSKSFFRVSWYNHRSHSVVFPFFVVPSRILFSAWAPCNIPLRLHSYWLYMLSHLFFLFTVSNNLLSLLLSPLPQIFISSTATALPLQASSLAYTKLTVVSYPPFMHFQMLAWKVRKRREQEIE